VAEAAKRTEEERLAEEKAAKEAEEAAKAAEKEQQAHRDLVRVMGHGRGHWQ